MILMYPLRNPDLRYCPANDGSVRRALAMSHALHYAPWSLWGDKVRRPRSLVLARNIEDRWEAFGVGAPSPALPWLLDGQLRTEVQVMGPPRWRDAVAKLAGTVVERVVEAWHPPETVAPPNDGAEGLVRRLDWRDKFRFFHSVPPRSNRTWGDFMMMCTEGAVFGIPLRDGSGFASLAWLVELSRPYATITVATQPKYRRLGLGAAVGRALVRAMINAPAERRVIPIAFLDPTDEAARGIVRTLGFRHLTTEPVVHWKGAGAAIGEGERGSPNVKAVP